jgi:lipid A 3-O-deacylase
MTQFFIATALLFSASFSLAGLPTHTICPPPIETPIYRDYAVDFETGFIGQVGGNTPIDYRLVPTQLSLRTPRWFGADFDSGASLSVRHKITLLGTWVAEGPEHRYLGFMFSPSVEYWNAAKTWGIYSSAGGGFGWIDAQGVEGGQGQDFTYNWFAQLGLEFVLNETLSLRTGAMFQHMSNRGATDPNPGIDALGVTLGLSWRL